MDRHSKTGPRAWGAGQHRPSVCRLRQTGLGGCDGGESWQAPRRWRGLWIARRGRGKCGARCQEGQAEALAGAPGDGGAYGYTGEVCGRAEPGQGLVSRLGECVVSGASGSAHHDGWEPVGECAERPEWAGSTLWTLLRGQAGDEPGSAGGSGEEEVNP